MPRLALLLLLACGDDAPAPTRPPSNGAGDCTDSAVNPWVGGCTASFFSCFDGAGACEGTLDFAGGLSLAWANGAALATLTDTTNPLLPEVSSALLDSDGAVCATSETVEPAVGDCTLETRWVRSSDEATLLLCLTRQGTLVALCPDGETWEVARDDVGAGYACLLGEQPCAIEVEPPDL